MMHTFDPNTCEAEFQASLGYIASKFQDRENHTETLSQKTNKTNKIKK